MLRPAGCSANLHPDAAIWIWQHRLEYNLDRSLWSHWPSFSPPLSLQMRSLTSAALVILSPRICRPIWPMIVSNTRLPPELDPAPFPAPARTEARRVGILNWRELFYRGWATLQPPLLTFRLDPPRPIPTWRLWICAWGLRAAGP